MPRMREARFIEDIEDQNSGKVWLEKPLESASKKESECGVENEESLPPRSF